MIGVGITILVLVILIAAIYGTLYVASEADGDDR